MCVHYQVETCLNTVFENLFAKLLPEIWNEQWSVVAEKALQVLHDTLHQDPLNIPANITTIKGQILTAYMLANTLTPENIGGVYLQLMKSSNQEVVKYLSFFLNESNRKYLVIWRQTSKSSYSQLQEELYNVMKKNKSTDQVKTCLKLLGYSCCRFFSRVRVTASQGEANFFPRKCYVPKGDVDNSSNHRLSTFLCCYEISSPQYWASSGYYYTGFKRTLKCAWCKYEDTDPPVTENEAVHLSNCIPGGNSN